MDHSGMESTKTITIKANMKNEMMETELKALIEQFIKEAKTADDLPDLIAKLGSNYHAIIGNNPGKIPGSTVGNLYKRSKQIKNHKKNLR